MRYIVYGAGAVGGVIGARLFRHGFDVVLIARGAHLEAMQQRGLLFRWPDGEATLPIRAVSHPSEIDFRPDDVVLLTMKTQDTEPALVELEAAAGSDVPVICCQNGVENERLAARRFENVYGAYVTMLSSYLTPGLVEASATPQAGIVDPGRFPSGLDAVATTFAANLETSMISAVPTAEIMRWKHSKLLQNLSNSLNAICSNGPETAEIRRRLQDEGKAVFAAAGIDLITDEQSEERRKKSQMNRPGGAPAGSTSQSIARATGSVETDYLNGEISLLGRIHGIPTPANEAIRRLANRLARERGKPGSLAPEEIWRVVGELGGAVPAQPAAS